MLIKTGVIRVRIGVRHVGCRSSEEVEEALPGRVMWMEVEHSLSVGASYTVYPSTSLILH